MVVIVVIPLRPLVNNCEQSDLPFVGQQDPAVIGISPIPVPAIEWKREAIARMFFFSVSPTRLDCTWEVRNAMNSGSSRKRID